jgi:hypothetical protein
VNVANVFHFAFNNAVTFVAPTKAQIFTAFQGAQSLALTNCLSVRYTGIGITVRFMDDALDPPQDMGAPANGAITGDSNSSQLAAYIRLPTSYKGRSYQGSKHVGPIGEADTQGNEIVTPTPAWWSTLVTNMSASLVAGGMTYLPFVFSRKVSQAETNPTTIYTPFITSSPAPYLRRNTGTMRKRRSRLTTAA